MTTTTKKYDYEKICRLKKQLRQARTFLKHEERNLLSSKGWESIPTDKSLEVLGRKRWQVIALERGLEIEKSFHPQYEN